MVCFMPLTLCSYKALQYLAFPIIIIGNQGIK